MLARPSAKVRPGAASLTILALSCARCRHASGGPSGYRVRSHLHAHLQSLWCWMRPCRLAPARRHSDWPFSGGGQAVRRLPGLPGSLHQRADRFYRSRGCPPAAAAAQGAAAATATVRRHIGPIARMTDSRFVSARPQDRHRVAESAQAVMTCRADCLRGRPGQRMGSFGCSQDKPNTRHGRFLGLGAASGEFRMRRQGRCPGRSAGQKPLRKGCLCSDRGQPHRRNEAPCRAGRQASAMEAARAAGAEAGG